MQASRQRWPPLLKANQNAPNFWRHQRLIRVMGIYSGVTAPGSTIKVKDACTNTSAIKSKDSNQAEVQQLRIACNI